MLCTCILTKCNMIIQYLLFGSWRLYELQTKGTREAVASILECILLVVVAMLLLALQTFLSLVVFVVACDGWLQKESSFAGVWAHLTRHILLWWHLPDPVYRRSLIKGGSCYTRLVLLQLIEFPMTSYVLLMRSGNLCWQ